MTPLPLLLLLGAVPAHARYDAVEAARLVPLLSEVLRFPTVQGNAEARAAQQAWLRRVGVELGFDVREAGGVTEVELPGPTGAPVLGLVVHGDVQPVDETAWSAAPFAGEVRDGHVVGRGAADDKGPLVQALLAMRALAQAGPARTHTVRLLVGTDEESDNTDIRGYLEGHRPPNLSLVLDSSFPVVVGEKAWQSLAVTTPLARPASAPADLSVAALEAGLATSIVPDRARIVLRHAGASADWTPLVGRLGAKPLAEGIRLQLQPQGDTLTVTTLGRSAHAGMNLEGGRNALVALARLMEGELPASGAADLLAFARLAGQDLHGASLGLSGADPLWGRYDVNVATIKPAEGARPTLTINLRRVPPMTGPELRRHLERVVADFNARTGALLEPGGFFDDEPLVFDPGSKLARRLLAIYERATGETAAPAISGGGSYAKRLPNAIAFGMWFPGKPYPGHDVDERNPIADLHRGAHVLIEALVDLACAPPLVEPFKP